MARFADAEGAVFGAWQAGTHRGPVRVDEPGAVVFTGLTCRDREAARAFEATSVKVVYEAAR